MTRMPQNLKPMMNTSNWMDSKKKQGGFSGVKTQDICPSNFPLTSLNFTLNFPLFEIRANRRR